MCSVEAVREGNERGQSITKYVTCMCGFMNSNERKYSTSLFGSDVYQWEDFLITNFSSKLLGFECLSQTNFLKNHDTLATLCSYD